MKLGRFLTTVFSIFGLTFLGAAPVSAGTISASGKITITAVVAPEHYIIVDNSNTITEIISNTVQDTAPLAFKDKIIKGNELQLTPEIYAQYNKLIKPGKSYIGIMYKQPSVASVATHPYAPQANNLLLATRFLRMGF
jgi:hypothetical protein